MRHPIRFNLMIAFTGYLSVSLNSQKANLKQLPTNGLEKNWCRCSGIVTKSWKGALKSTFFLPKTNFF